MHANGWNTFLKWCLASQDARMLSLLLDLLLTQEEKESVSSRCLIVQELLKRDKTQREMAADLNVSIAKITRGSNELRRTPEELINFLRNTILTKHS